MAQSSGYGAAQSLSSKDFNERLKRLLETKPDLTPPEKPKQAARRFVRNGPKP